MPDTSQIHSHGIPAAQTPFTEEETVSQTSVTFPDLTAVDGRPGIHT